MKVKKPKPPIVLNDTEAAPEFLASSITELSTAVKRLLAGPLTKRAITVLIRDSLKAKVSARDVEAVLNAAGSLGEKYVVRKVAKTVATT